MRKSGQILLFLLLVLGLFSLSSCGGGATGSLGSSFDLPGASADGVTSGDFKAIRFNDRGYADPALNPTLDLRVSQDGATTTVTVLIDDQDPMLGAAVDLFYDPARYSPVNTAFSGLVETPLELASTRRSGIISVGQAATTGTGLRSGEFATVTFANSPLRFAAAAGDAHQAAVSRGYAPSQAGAPNIASGLEVTKAAIDATDAEYKVYSFFAVGDGNADGSTTLGDLTAMVFNGYFGSANAISVTDWGTMPSDYNGDGETGVTDLTSLGQRLGEATTSIDILIKDNDGNDFAGTETVAATHTWASGSDPARPPAAGTIDVDALMRIWTGTIDLAAATTADVNNDGIVLLSAVARGTGASSPAFTDASLQVTRPVGPVGPDGVVVTGFTGNIAAGTPQPFDSATTAVTLVAGEDVVLEITGISGTYDPGGGDPSENFDGGPSASMPQADYDGALASVQGAAAWSVQSGGDAGFRTTVPVLALAATVGSGIAGSVTPDDDPESTAPGSAEGSLSVSIAASGSFIPLALSASFDVDVDADAEAPVLNSVITDQPDAGSFRGLNPVGATQVSASGEPGTLDLPADPSTISLSLVPTYASGEAFGGANPIDLTYTAGVPDTGEFSVVVIPGPPVLFTLLAVVPSSAVPGVVYSLQVSFDNGGSSVVSSANKPGDGFMTLGTPPPPVDFVTIPEGDNLLGKNDVLLITYPEPSLRRDQRVTVGNGNVVPTDADGFNDVVKATGSGFSLTSDARDGGGFDNFPVVIVALGNDPGIITSSTVSEPVSIAFRGPSSIVLDISSITFAGTNPVDYCFKVFGAAAEQANWPTLGTGTFTYSPTGIAPASPSGVDWGINIFDDAARGDLDLAGRDYSNKQLNASSIGQTASDVLFVEVSNFGFFDWDLTDPFDYLQPYSGTNTRLRFTDVNDGSQTYAIALVPCAGNLGVTGSIIAMFEFTNEQFSAAQPGWQGILTPGETYSLTLQDPLAPANDFTFPDNMIVIGTNPN